ncbi:MAG: hypothetical protein ABI720_09715 [Actinomycetes bacterium]
MTESGLKGAPDVFVARVNARIAVVGSGSGKVRRFLTKGGKWVADSHPVLVKAGGRQYVYYLHENFKRCPNSIRRIPLHGGTSEQVTRQPFQIMGMSVSPNGRYLAYSAEGCRAPVTRDFAEVVSLRTGEVVQTVTTPRERNVAPIGLGSVTVTNHQLVVFAGVHLTTWLSVLSLDRDAGDYRLLSLPHIPVRCRLDRLASSPSPSRVFGSVTCGHRIKTFTASGPRLQRVRYSDPIPLDMDWAGVSSRTRQGWYIGNGNPAGKGGGDHIIQWRGDAGRMLKRCSTPKKTGGLCADQVTWSTLGSHTPTSRHKSSGHRKFDKPGIKTRVDQPAPSIQFSTSNAWTGWYEGAYLAVYAGSAGYEHPDKGSVMVFTYDDNHKTRLGYTRKLPGTGALTVVSVSKPEVVLRDEHGQTHTLNLNARTLT